MVSFKKHNSIIHENLIASTNQDSRICFTSENLKILTYLQNILAFLTINHLQAELRIEGEILLHVIPVFIIVSYAPTYNISLIYS